MFCKRRALQLSPKTVTMETQPCRAHSATMLLFTTNERCIAPKKNKTKKQRQRSHAFPRAAYGRLRNLHGHCVL